MSTVTTERATAILDHADLLYGIKISITVEYYRSLKFIYIIILFYFKIIKSDLIYEVKKIA